MFLRFLNSNLLRFLAGCLLLLGSIVCIKCLMSFESCITVFVLLIVVVVVAQIE